MANVKKFAFHETNTPFPNIVLLWDNRPCAAIGYRPESTGTLLVAAPVVIVDASDEVRRALCRRLLEQVKRHAVSAGMQRLHLLLPASAGDAGFERLLTEIDFVNATHIVQWDLSVAVNPACLSPYRTALQLYTFDANPAAACEIESAIDAILECSEDLNSQPPPTAAELLSKWQCLTANVFLYRIDQEIAGLIAFVTNPISFTEAAVPSTLLASEANVCIEYIGVVPAFRRKQIASQMIRQIPTLLGGDPGRIGCILPRALKVTAYSDAANTPANCLYQRCGFVQTTGHHLWCCDLAKTNGDGHG